MNAYTIKESVAIKKLAADLFDVRVISDRAKTNELYEKNIEQIIDFELWYF